MGTDCFIKFDGVSGESTDAAHKGSIDVLAWSWGVANAPLATGSGSGAGKAVPAPLVFQHRYDKASPPLGRLCASGLHVKQVKLTARHPAAGLPDFLVVTMKDVLVSQVQVALAADGSLQESVSLVYGDIEFAYKPQTPAGALGAAVKFGWDTQRNVVR